MPQSASDRRSLLEYASTASYYFSTSYYCSTASLLLLYHLLLVLYHLPLRLYRLLLHDMYLGLSEQRVPKPFRLRHARHGAA